METQARSRGSFPLCSALAVCLACGAERAAEPPAASVPSTNAAPPAVERPAPATPAPVAPAPARAEGLGLRLVRELDRPVLHIALDKPPHAAALVEGGVFVHDAKGWREDLLPPNLRESKALALKVFFGRDYRVRVVGSDSASGNVESVYLRWLPGGLRSAFDEIGRLGNTRRGPLVAVLGTADPELVCRPTEVCLVKRISGWKQLPAAANLAQVAITNEQGFAIVGQQLLRAEQEWRPVGTLGPWREAGPLFVIGERAFVLEPGRKLVHALDRAGTWASLDSPVGAPRALWGAAEDVLWLAGENGIARYDGKAWQSVAGGPSDVRAVLGRSGDDVWFGAGSGLYRLEGAGAGS